ncbi:MAG: hypothetical protein ATN33_01180 [Epulopiscium sp. Nele67-Bin001]|nr:MAG: hypothetical protein BEN18_07340 [Epulopiscium sp. Nuni2H_MBin001]OON91417.1 MAG: hypothetical protein ATN33_01180 [Epulopiscium sp. Nele67-Bin001]
MVLLYLAIGLLASTVGAISGLGGGVIIKPILDMFGHYDIATIGILSASTVFAMSIATLTKKFIDKATFELDRLLPLSFGAVIGGIAGNKVFQLFMNAVGNPDTAKMIQSICLATLMIVVFIFCLNKDKVKTFDTHNILICFIAGLIMGTISAFLGIGGGPVNVMVLILLFSCNSKDAATYSVFTIFFSQMSTLGTTLLTEGFGVYDLSLVGYMIFGGIVGGFLGDIFSKKMNTEQVSKLFNAIMIIVILINVYNIFSVLMA